jgi:hypothetical protein
MLKDFSVPVGAWLGGIDARLFYYSFGKSWAEELISQLNLINNSVWYLYAKSISEQTFLTWLKTREMPVFYEISPSRLGALLLKSNVVLSGKTVLFELANLLNRPAIGLFKENEITQYCRLTSQSIGVPYSEKPDEQTISDIYEKVRMFFVPI